MSNNTGGPAFPAHHFDLAEGEHGMTLRDYFAAQAMHALLVSLEAGKEQQAALIPRTAYDIADVMLKAREEDNGS